MQSTGQVCWARCNTEVEKGGKGSGWVQPIWQHRNVEASVVLIEDSLPKTRKFTCKFSVSICRKYQAIDPHLQSSNYRTGPAHPGAIHPPP